MIDHPVLSLGVSKDLSAIPKLLNYLRSNDYNNSSNARQALWSFGGNFWDVDKNGETIIPDLIKASTSSDKRQVISAIWALHHLAERELLTTPEFKIQSVTVLIDKLDDEDADIRLSTVHACLRLKNSRIVPPLVRRLNDEDRLIVLRTAEVLGFLQYKRAVPALLQTLTSNSDMLVQHRIISALGSIKASKAVPVLIEILHNGTGYLRGSAAFALGGIGDKQATTDLLKALHIESNQETREWIVVGLGRLKDKRAVPNLVKVLNDIGSNAKFTYKIRDNTAFALGEIKDEAAISALIEATHTAPEWQVRMAAVDALAFMGKPEDAAARLVDILLNHKISDVRAIAAKDLGYLGKASKEVTLRDHIVLNLIKSLSDKGEGFHYRGLVCNEAAHSLAHIRTREALKALEEWCKGQLQTGGGVNLP